MMTTTTNHYYDDGDYDIRCTGANRCTLRWKFPSHGLQAHAGGETIASKVVVAREEMMKGEYLRNLS